MSVADGGADLVVVNGRVLTIDDDNPAAEAVAVKDGVIIAVGDRASIEEFKGPTTKVVDAQGGSVLPGPSALIRGPDWDTWARARL